MILIWIVKLDSLQLNNQITIISTYTLNVVSTKAMKNIFLIIHFIITQKKKLIKLSMKLIIFTFITVFIFKRYFLCVTL